jgi:hypothetical protein
MSETKQSNEAKEEMAGGESTTAKKKRKKNKKKNKNKNQDENAADKTGETRVFNPDLNLKIPEPDRGDGYMSHR